MMYHSNKRRCVRTCPSIKGKAFGFTREREDFMDEDGVWHTISYKEGTFEDGKAKGLLYHEVYGDVVDGKLEKK